MEELAREFASTPLGDLQRRREIINELSNLRIIHLSLREEATEMGLSFLLSKN